MLEERRQFPRLVPSTPLFVSMEDAKSGLLLDLCEGGLAVASLVPRNLDDVFSLAFDLPEGVGHIEATAQVAWTRDSGHLTGVRFMNLDEVSQQQLSEWIAAGTNLRPAGSEEVDEPVIVTRSTYAQVDAIRREVRPESRPDLWMDAEPMRKPQVDTHAIDNKIEAPAAPTEMAMEAVAEPGVLETTETSTPAAEEKAAPAMEMTGTLFPDSSAEVESEPDAHKNTPPFTAKMSFTEMDGDEPSITEAPSAVEDVVEPEIEAPFDAKPLAAAGETTDVGFGIPEMEMAETSAKPEPVAAPESAMTVEMAADELETPGSTNRAQWVEHIAQMEEIPAGARFDAGHQPLPPDSEIVGWASDAVGWVQEIAEKRVSAPEEAEFDGMFPVESGAMAKAGRTTRSRYTIELVLAVVLLTWALVFLGYQMGSTGASRTAHDLTTPKPAVNGAAPANAKGDVAKPGNPSTASFSSAESFPEMSPVPPISRGRSSVAPSNSAGIEIPAPAPNRSAAVAPKTPAPSPHETARASAETTVLEGPSPAINSGVVLQVGAMKMEGNATALMQDLKKKKFSAFVYRHGNDNLYRVAVGPFGDKDASAKVKSELQKNGYPAITAKWVKDKG
jgi:cell division septation protein DedD